MLEGENTNPYIGFRTAGWSPERKIRRERGDVGMVLSGEELNASGDPSSGAMITCLENGREKFLNYIRKRIPDQDTAEDVLQDCLLKAVKSASNIRDEEKLVSWFYRVLKNAITDIYRRGGTKGRRMIEYVDNVDTSVRAEDERAICQCLGDILPTLKPEYAEVIEFLDLQEGNPGEVSKRLGISRNNLKVRTHRARQALRRRLMETCKICAEHHCLDCSCRPGAHKGGAPP